MKFHTFKWCLSTPRVALKDMKTLAQVGLDGGCMAHCMQAYQRPSSSESQLELHLITSQIILESHVHQIFWSSNKHTFCFCTISDCVLASGMALSAPFYDWVQKAILKWASGILIQERRKPIDLARTWYTLRGWPGARREIRQACCKFTLDHFAVITRIACPVRLTDFRLNR